MFSKYGPVSDVYVPLDFYTRYPRGFAYVQYPLNSPKTQKIYRFNSFVITFFFLYVFVRLESAALRQSPQKG